MQKWNIFKVTPTKKRRKFNWNRIPRQAERGAERRPLLMLRWFFYIFSLLYILCNLYVCTRRIRNVCASVCVCNYFLYILAYFIKNYMNMQMQMLPELHLQFVYCFLYRFWHFLFCSNAFLLFFIRPFFFVRHVNFESIAQKIMYTALCGRLYMCIHIPNASYQIFNAWNIKQTKFFTKKS